MTDADLAEPDTSQSAPPDRPLDEFIDAVARNVKQVRATRGLSQAELARQSGIAKATLSQLEVGNGNPTIETLFALAKVLQVPLGVLLQEVPSEPTRVSRAADRPAVKDTTFYMSLLDSFTAGRTLYELYLVVLTGDGRRESDAHAPGVTERMLLTEGALLTGPVNDPVELHAGDFVCFAADRPHVYEALAPRVTASLLMSYPLSPPAA